MSVFRTDDPIADFNAWDAEQDRWLKERPVCVWCEEAVQEDYYYLINDEVCCPECLESYFRKEVDAW